MPFNLYFAGSYSKVTEEEIERRQLLRLMSYFNDKKGIARRVGKSLSTFIDSGAFSAHTKGIEPDVDDYIRYVNELDDYCTIFAQLDTIPGEFGKPKTQQQLEEAPELSWQNYLYMVERVKSPQKLLPIFHQGEDFSHLQRMLNFEPKIEYMGISPANDVPTPVKFLWLEEVFKIIKNSPNPTVKTHAFGMTSLKGLERFPFTSADSTSWIMYAANGQVLTKYGAVFISEKTLKDPKSLLNQPPAVQEEIEKHFAEAGYTIKQLSEDYKVRALWNIFFMDQWARNYQYKERPVRQSKLFEVGK